MSLLNSCYHSIKEENHSDVQESEYQSLADKIFLESLNKRPQEGVTFCLHHDIPILWQSPKFDAMTRQLTEKKLVNNTKAAMGNGMECPMGSKAAKAATVM